MRRGCVHGLALDLPFFRFNEGELLAVAEVSAKPAFHHRDGKNDFVHVQFLLLCFYLLGGCLCGSLIRRLRWMHDERGLARLFRPLDHLIRHGIEGLCVGGLVFQNGIDAACVALLNHLR